MTGIPDRRSPCRIDASKGPRRHHCSTWHAELVEGFRLAQEAQEARAERATQQYATELAAYFDPLTGTEHRLTFREWLVGMADPARHQAAA